MNSLLPRQPVILGLTGPIASGKSTIARWLAERGADVIDADRVYGSLVTPGSPLLAAIASRFGDRILRPDGSLDRGTLAAMVFSDPSALADLDRLTHPAVVAEVRRRIRSSRAPVIVVEAIKLVPAGLDADTNALWLVTADEETRIERLIDRNGMSFSDARARAAGGWSELPDDIQPDVVIDTSGSLDDVQTRVDEAWAALLESHQVGDSVSRRRFEEER